MSSLFSGVEGRGLGFEISGFGICGCGGFRLNS